MHNMKKYLMFVIGTLLAFSAYGQSKLPPCSGSDLTKWSSCFGTGSYANSYNYVGDWKDGKPHGQGTYTSANGGKYVGEFKKGIKNGQETYAYTNGTAFKEQWTDSLQNKKNYTNLIFKTI